MNVVTKTLRTLALVRPSLVFETLMAGIDAAVADHEFDASEEDITGRGLAFYGERLTIDPIPGISASPLAPETLTVYHSDFYADALMIATYAHGVRMFAIPAQDFGIVERPRGDHDFLHGVVDLKESTKRR